MEQLIWNQPHLGYWNDVIFGYEFKTLGVKAPVWQGAKKLESAAADSELSHLSQVGCINAQNNKLFWREP